MKMKMKSVCCEYYSFIFSRYLVEAPFHEGAGESEKSIPTKLYVLHVLKK